MEFPLVSAEDVKIRSAGFVQYYNLIVDNGVGGEITERFSDLREAFVEVLAVPRVQDVRRVALSAAMQVESVSHHYDVLGKRLVLDSTDRESHFLSRFETVVIHNVGQNEGNLGAVHAINNSKPLRVNFLDDSYHFVSSPRARPVLVQHLPWPPVEQGTSLFIVLSRLLARV